MSVPSRARRRFLGTALAVGAGAATWALGSRSFGVEWDGTPVGPLSEPTLRIHRGPLAVGTSATVQLWFSGPGISEPLLMDEQTVTLAEGPTEVRLVLAYAHPRLVAGRFAYTATVRATDRDAKSDELSYTLHRFTFGV